MLGLAEGSLLASKSHPRVVLTGDEKKALLARVQATPIKFAKPSNEAILLEQRDQALRELTRARNEVQLYRKIVEDQEAELKAMTIWGLVRRRLAAWIHP